MIRRLNKMNRLFQLAIALLLVATLAPAHAQPRARSPSLPAKTSNGYGSTLPTTPTRMAARTTSFRTIASVPSSTSSSPLRRPSGASPINGKYRSLASTALDHLTVPDKVLADDNRYISISGCVVHFCPARGLLWLDLNGTHHLVVFAAIDWIKHDKPTSDPAAEYTLWVFPNDPLSIAGNGPHPPAALIKAIARWAAQPLPGSAIVQNITHAILVDPDGTPHQVDALSPRRSPHRAQVHHRTRYHSSC